MSTTAPDRVNAPGSVGDDQAAAANGGGRRRRDSSEPASFGRLRPPSRRRAGLSLLGVPVAAVVAIELVAMCALLVAEKKVIVRIIAVALGVGIIVTALLRRRSIRIGSWLILRVAYLFRHRETLVAAPGARRGDHGGPDGVTDIDAPPELEAFFPGMAMWESRTHDGDRMGVIQWHGTCAATLRIGPPGGIVRARSTSENVPIDAIMAALDGQDLGIDAVQVLTQTIVGEQNPSATPLLSAATAELGGGRARVRNRTAFVTVRLDPATAAAAITARGGGNTGIGRVLSAALSRIRATCGEHGLNAQVLDPVEAARAIAESLYHQATPYDPIIRWDESSRFIASTRMAHRSFVVTDVRRPALADLPVGNVFAYALGIQVRPLPTGGWSTRTVLRLTCRSVDSLAGAARELRSTARRAGVIMQPLDAVQHLGLRATVPIGGV
ncbi:MAG TPA: type VII secretion protein EccE [Jatrophihabitans sp.]|jgi:type VII secretion protein EccE